MNLRKITAVLTGIKLIISTIVTNVSADNTATYPFNSNYKYSGGVSNITVYLNYSSGVAAWENYITQGVTGWMYTGWNNPIYMNYVSSNVGSKMDFHSNDATWFSNNTGYSTALACTFHFLGNGTNINTGPNGVPVSSWYYSEIHINTTELAKDDYSNDSAQGTIYHEMGHAFGLAHNNTNPDSIMHQYSVKKYLTPSIYTIEYRAVNTVQYIDNQAIVTLYE